MTRHHKITWQAVVEMLLGIIWLAAAVACIWAWATYP
jgi:hypothetical protein